MNLPPLPKPHRVNQALYAEHEDLYTAEQVRQAQREAIAAKDAQIAKLETELNRLQAAMHRGMQAKAVAAAVPGGWNLVPIEPTHEIISAMASSRARDDEGDFPLLLDLIDFSGENKTNAVLIAAYKAMIAAAPEVKPDPAQSKIEKES